ncbi:MAG: hypothetical protein HRU15_04095, partial [Planctomycetes bacterium]|nr:hypothetical protein [Planctomycetota bacterium]
MIDVKNNVCCAIFVVLTVITVGMGCVAAEERELQWAKRAWIVKSADAQGPGPNAWSADKQSVWVDEQGQLHLKIRYDEVRKRWLCAEIRSKEPTGFGHYLCTVSSDMTVLDKNMVFGFFAYADDQHEVDVEYSAWGTHDAAMEQFVVQPFDKKGHLQKFAYCGGETDYAFQWTADTI